MYITHSELQIYIIAIIQMYTPHHHTATENHMHNTVHVCDSQYVMSVHVCVRESLKRLCQKCDAALQVRSENGTKCGWSLTLWLGINLHLVVTK